VIAKPGSAPYLRQIGIALIAACSVSLHVHAQAPPSSSTAFATYLGSDQNDAVIAIESNAAGAVYILSYDGSGCVLSKLAPNGPGAWLNSYSYPLGPASCDAMAVAPTGEVFVGRTGLSNETYVQTFSDTAGFPQSIRLVNLWHMSGVRKLRVDSRANIYAVGSCRPDDNGNLWPLPRGVNPAPDGNACSASSSATQWLLTVNNAVDDLTYGTFLGPVDNFAVQALDIDEQGKAYVAGITGTGGLTAITADAYQSAPGITTCIGPGCIDSDAFLMVFDTSEPLTGSDTLRYSSFFGGGGGEFTVGMARGADGIVVLTGVTQSGNFPLTTSQTVAQSSSFVARLDLARSGTDQLLFSALAIESPLTGLSEPPRIRLLPGGEVALVAETANPDYPLIKPIYSAPPSSGTSKPLLVVYNPATASTTFASYLDDVQLARDLRIASDPSGTLLVAMTTSETGRSTDGSVGLGQDEVLALAISTVNQPPTVTNFTKREIVATSPDGVVLQLTAVADDPDGDSISAVWAGPFGNISNSWPASSGSQAPLSAAVRLPIGESSISLTVYDDAGGHVVAETFTVNVTAVNTIAGDFGGQPQVVRPPDDNLAVGAGVTAGRVEVRFTGQVNVPGLVWMRTRTDQTPPPPFGMQSGSSPFYYDVGYYAPAGGPGPLVQGTLQLCIDHSGISFVDPANVQMFTLAGGSWSQVTPTQLVTDPADYKFRMICADRPADNAFGTYALMTPADAATAIATIESNLDGPVSAVYDINPAGNRNYLYIADASRFLVYRRNLADGTTSVVAGDGTMGAFNPPDNVDATASQVGPYGLAVDAFGNLFVADASHCSIRRVDAATNIITTVAGIRTDDENLCGHAGDGGPANAARIGRVGHMVFDAEGNLFISDEWTPAPGPVIGYIRRIAAVNGVITEGVSTITTIAGNGSSDLPVEGTHPSTSGSYAYDLAFGPDGNLYVSFVSAIFRIARGAGSLDTVIDGSGDERFERIAGGNYGFAYLMPFAGDGGLARDAFVQNPMAILVLPNGDLLYTETFMNRIRRISGGADHLVNGVNAADCGTSDTDCERITTIAGFTDNAGAIFPPPSNGDGLALQTRLGYPIHMAIDPRGGFAMVEIGQGFTRVRHVGVSGVPIVPPPPPIAVTLLAPLAGAKVFVNVPVVVRWQATGALTSFSIELSLTATDRFVPIAACANLPASATSCAWTPTGTYQPEARVRVIARNTAQTVSDTSGPFQIAITPPVITVNVPNTAVHWAIGSTQLIRWSHNLGAAALVRLELSRDGGASWEALGAPMHNLTATVGQMDWQVTGPPTATALIRAMWTDGPATDTSNVPFAIEDPRITVTTPNGGQIWTLDGQRPITWTHNLGTNIPVSVELSRDGGTSWTTIAGSMPNTGVATGQFNWLVTGPAAAQARVRVRTVSAVGAGGIVADASDADFTIASRIRITSPNTNVTWAAGTPRLVTWTHTYPTTQLFDVDVSTDGGVTWATAVRNVQAPNAGIGSGTIIMPTTPTAQAIVRVSPAGHPEDGDRGDVPFTLVPPSITVTSPNINVSATLGSALTIRWTHNLGDVPIDVSISRDGGATWNEIAHHVSGANLYTWNVLPPVTSRARVRVAWVGTAGSVEDTSDVDFRIASRIHVDYPNTNISWAAGSRQRISWTHPFGGAQLFDVDTSTDNGLTWTAAARDVLATAPTSGSAAIILPATPTTQTLVRVSPAGSPAEGDVNDAPFTLVPATVRVTTPNTNINWVLGSSHSIYWSHNLGSSLLNKFDVAVSFDSGQTWSGIANDVNNGYNFHSWTVNGIVTTHARVRVRWNEGTTSAEDISDVDFTISSRIHVDYPNTNISWAAGSRQRISWTHNYGGTQQFDVDVSADGGATWTAAARNVLATGETSGSTAIVLPATPTTQTLVRVNPAGRTNQGDVNDVPFSLVPATVRVTTPNTNVNWQIGSSHSIYWSHNLGSSLLNKFDVAVSFDGGQTWSGIANDVNNGYNFYSWTVNGLVTTRARVRVRWNEGTVSAEDVSDVDFTISPRVRVTSPNTVVSWVAFGSHTITWTHNYTATQNFDVDFSPDAGVTWTRLASTVPAASATSGSCTAVMPGTPTVQALIRVSASNTTLERDRDTSDVPFIVRPVRIVP